MLVVLSYQLSHPVFPQIFYVHCQKQAREAHRSNMLLFLIQGTVHIQSDFPAKCEDKQYESDSEPGLLYSCSHWQQALN